MITVNDDYKTTLAFGESQLLGLDSSDKNKPFVHDLLKIFPNRNFIIYAAPNNGPFEVLHQISQNHKNFITKNRSLIIGFSADRHFRIRKVGTHEILFPFKLVIYQKFFIPGYHDLLLLMARIKGVKFGSTVSNNEKVKAFTTLCLIKKGLQI